MLELRPVLKMTAHRHPAYDTLTSLSDQGVPMRPWATRTAKTALLAAGFAAAAGGLSGVALAAGSNASSGASPGLSLGQLVAPAGVCDNAGALLGVVGAACRANCGGTPPGTSPGGTTTTVSTGTAPSRGLPTAGADLLLLGVAALGSIGVGAGAVAVARRRRNGEA